MDTERLLQLSEDEAEPENLRVIKTVLAGDANALQIANARLTALGKLNAQLASERDPRVLLQKVCLEARQLIGARYAVLVVRNSNGLFFTTAGLETPGKALGCPSLDTGLLGRVLSENQPIRVSGPRGHTIDTGLPESYPAARALVAVPITSPMRTHGWLCLFDKPGAEGFDLEDERILCILGAQVGRIYENGSLYVEVQEYAAQLVTEIEERERLKRLYTVLSGINSLVIRVRDRLELCTQACRVAVDDGQFALAAIGLPGAVSRQLVPFAHAGTGAAVPELMLALMVEGTVPGKLIARALASQQPAICDDLRLSECDVPHREELSAQGYRSIAVLPLVVEGVSRGCLLLVTRDCDFFNETELRLLTNLADDVAFALDHIEKAERLNYLAFYDELTGLANRALFLERLANEVSTAERNQDGFALVVTRPERIEAVNETLGRPAADQLVRQIAERFTRCVGEERQVACIGPNLFAAFIPRPARESDIAEVVGGWWREMFGPSFAVDGNELKLSAKAGITIYPNDGDNATALLANAEAALSSAKTTEDAHLFYTRRLSEQLAARLELDRRLTRALANSEFVLHYQPKVNVETRRLEGVEALMRWQSPEFGLLPPSQFIATLEDMGLIHEVGAWALQQACRDRAEWLARELPAPRIAVNVSTKQMRKEGFVRLVAEILGQSQSNAPADSGIDIEITESLVMEDVVGNIEKLAALRRLGVGIAMDDFGTGYSSLAYLARLPVDTLKIDRVFIGAMLDDPTATSLVSMIISLGHTLHLTVIAEGVETEDQARMLRLLRCEQMQGYLVGAAMTRDSMNEYLASR